MLAEVLGYPWAANDFGVGANQPAAKLTDAALTFRSRTINWGNIADLEFSAMGDGKRADLPTKSGQVSVGATLEMYVS
jgi:hypothetical protein